MVLKSIYKCSCLSPIFLMPSYTPNKPGKDDFGSDSSHPPLLLTYFCIPNSLPYLGLGQPGKRFHDTSLSCCTITEFHTWKKGEKLPFFPFFTWKWHHYLQPSPPDKLPLAPPHPSSPVWCSPIPLAYGNSILPPHAFRLGFSSPLHDAIIRKWQPFVGWQMSCGCFLTPALSHFYSVSLSLPSDSVTQ